MFLLPIALLTTAQASQTLHYRTTAKPVSAILSDLSTLSGCKLIASRELAGEPLILYIRDRPLAEVKTKIARVLLSRWRTSPEGEVLEIDPTAWDDAGHVERELRLREVQKQLDAVKRSLAETPYTAPELDKWLGGLAPPATPYDNPEVRFGKRALLALGAQLISKLPWRSRTVFSNPPCLAGEVALPSICSEDDKLMWNELMLWREAWERAPSRRGEFGLYNYYYPEHEQGRIEVTVNELGELSCRVLSTIRDTVVKEAPISLPPPEEVPLSSPAMVQTLGLSAEPAIPRIKLLDPVAYDPLSFAISESILNVAKDQYSTVAWVSDELCYNRARNSEPSLASSQGGYESAVSLKVRDGWALISPALPVRARRVRLDRRAFRDILKAVQEDSFGALEKLAKFVDSNPNCLANELFYRGLFLAGGSRLDWTGGALLAYGCLSDSQRKSLLAGKTLTYSDLGTEQRRVLLNLPGFRDFTHSLSSLVEWRRDESGFPTTLRIKMKLSQWNVAVKKKGSEFAVIPPLNYFLHDHPEPDRGASDYVTWENASPGRRRELRLNIFAHGVNNGFVMTELTGGDSPEVPLKQFPAAFFEDVSRAGKEWQDAQKRLSRTGPKG